MDQLELTSLLAVHAHPDDETLSNGGLLAATAVAGLPTTVVTLTRGEQGEVIGELQDQLFGNGPALAAHRMKELTRALEALGVDEHVFLDQIPGPFLGNFADSGMAWVTASSESSGLGHSVAAGQSATAGLGEHVPPNALVKVPLPDLVYRLAQVIITARPQTVVTYEPLGGYGHPDHVRTHETVMAAIDLASAGIAGQSHVVQRVLWTVIPRQIAHASREALVACGNTAALQSGTASYLGPDDPLGSVSNWDLSSAQSLDVTAVLPRVVKALEAHSTQVQWTQTYDQQVPVEYGATNKAPRVTLAGSYALSNNIVSPLLSHEFYVTVPD